LLVFALQKEGLGWAFDPPRAHQKGNRVGSEGNAGCARLRRQRRKGKIQIRREPPIHQKEARADFFASAAGALIRVKGRRATL